MNETAFLSVNKKELKKELKKIVTLAIENIVTFLQEINK